MNDELIRLLNHVENKDLSDEKPLSKEEVEKIMKKFKTQNNTTSGKHISRKVLVAAIAAVITAVAVPVSVYAYRSHIAKIEKINNYQNTLTISPEKEIKNNDNSVSEVSDENKYMMWRFGYLPEGLVQDAYGYKYHDHETGAAITPAYYVIPEEMDTVSLSFKFSTNCENYESDGKTAMINYRASYEEEQDDPKCFGREVWISFTNTRYVLQLYISNGLSNEELYKIIDGVELYPTDQNDCEEHCNIYGEVQEEDTSESSYEDENELYGIENKNIYKKGEKIIFSRDSAPYSYTLNSAEITDSFEGISTDKGGDPIDFSELMDENGNLISNTRTWYKMGDGITTLDEHICTVDMPYHIVKTNITVTNESDEYAEISINGVLNYMTADGSEIVFMEEDTDIPSGYNKEEVYFMDSIDDCSYNIDTFFGYWFSYDTDEQHNGTKNYLNLEAGESADIQLCFICSENRLKKPYLSYGEYDNDVFDLSFIND